MSDNTSTGLSLTTVVFVVFLILRLVGVIKWSWWLVTAPLWAPIAVYLLVIVIYTVLDGLSKKVR
jgi:hypothetical protein